MTLLGNKLVGEITLRGMLGGKRYFAEMLMMIPLGIPLLSSVGRFDEFRWGIGSTSSGTILPWQVAEDNPVISWWRNNLWIKPGERSYSVEDKLPESTGDKLTAWGDGFQLSWGTRLDSPGEVLNCIGEVIPLNV